MAKQGKTPESLPGAHRAAEAEGTAQPLPSGALAELIEVEERVRAAIHAAETETARALAAAETEAGEHADAADHELAAALRSLERRIESERATVIADARDRSDEAVRRLKAIDEARIERLAEEVARRIAEGEPAGRESMP